MKRRIIISLAIILMSATFCSAKTDIDKFKVFTKEHPLRVLCDWNFPPYEYLDDNGEPAGFNVEVVDRILLSCKTLRKRSRCTTIKISTYLSAQEDRIKIRDFLTAMSHWDSIIYVLSTVRT